MVSTPNSTPVAPVVIDLAGDGFTFLSREAGVQFDYSGSGQKQATAWAGGSEGILAYDCNQDGNITLSREFVFTQWAHEAKTDLEALAQEFDSNQDGVLSALDRGWANFGLWVDANGDAVSDQGEFMSLTDLGIRSINLTYEAGSTAMAAANGDVAVAGTALVTWEDGHTSQAADASFMADVAVQTLATPEHDPVTGIALDGCTPLANPMPGPTPGEQHGDPLEHWVNTLLDQVFKAVDVDPWQALLKDGWMVGHPETHPDDRPGPQPDTAFRPHDPGRCPGVEPLPMA